MFTEFLFVEFLFLFYLIYELETENRYISPAQLPVKYGGLSNDNEQDFRESNTQDIVSEVTIKPSGTQRVEFCFMKVNILIEFGF